MSIQKEKKMTTQVYIAKHSTQGGKTIYCVKDASSGEMVNIPPSDRKADLRDMANSYSYELVSKPKAIA
jgi:hypothetical protein